MTVDEELELVAESTQLREVAESLHTAPQWKAGSPM